MLALLILPILISGYVLFRNHPTEKYVLYRYNGQLLYLRCAFYGVFCTAAGFLVVGLMNNYIPGEIGLFGCTIPLDIALLVRQTISPFIENLQTSNQLTWVVIGSLASIIIALFYTVFYSWYLIVRHFGFLSLFNRDENYVEQNKIIGMSELFSDSPLDNIFFNSFMTDEYLMLTMSDRKVYVGIVTTFGEPTESEGMDQEIVITPFLSGYRDSATLEVEFTTLYSDIDEELELVLKQENVISATVFSNDIYKKFSKHKADKEGSGHIPFALRNRLANSTV